MKPPAFEYYRPSTLPEALSLLSQSSDAKILAGGQSLIPMMNMRLARPGTVIDDGTVIRTDVLGGIIHEYEEAA